ncbi:hypothetical protein [Desulfosporosinus metallidurans]|uniref:Uncharacterized protein n=1 Tax=Desulfosporosinus metallidurans TaxID=1888891 RepID=A0A1Q8QM65_9FIRM|nr:hypothetical protein [Desulfosporosinus metallidurans]OLN28433.1 hypothetical protein DSOL_4082 [Desulfosporosinus metallidurans]
MLSAEGKTIADAESDLSKVVKQQITLTLEKAQKQRTHLNAWLEQLR